MDGLYCSADVATGSGLYAVGPDDDARHGVVAVFEAQAHASRLVRQPGQPVIQLNTVRRHGRGKETLKGRAVEGQVGRAHLSPVPLSYGMRPQEPTVSPAANLKVWRYVRHLLQLDTKALQQAGRVTADRD